MEKPTNNDHPLLESLRQRWSPLAFDPKPVPHDTLLSIFEAARWAPSCFNEQPWRFLVGVQGTETFAKLASTLVEGNAIWAAQAPVLFLGVAKTTFTHNDKPNRFGPYDVGQAMGHLTAQAAALGLHLHQMGGFSAEQARALFNIPENYEPMAMVALGYLGEASLLANETLQAKHNNPVRTRRSLAEQLWQDWESPLDQ